jgi:hypothetical protein
MFKIEVDVFDNYFIELLNEYFASKSTSLTFSDSETPAKSTVLHFNADILGCDIGDLLDFAFFHSKNRGHSF